MKDFYRNFNLFPSIPPSTDEDVLKKESISTRLFLLLLFAAMTILVLYTSLTTITRTVSIETPSLTQYRDLYNKHPQTLICPCSKISISYRDILSIEYSLHQVCSSVYTTDTWISFLDFTKSTIYAHFKDFYLIGPQVFQGLKAFCNLVDNTINENLNKFYLNEYVSAFATSSELFQSEIVLSIDQFRVLLTNNFLLSLAAIHDTTEGNALLSAQMTNYELYNHDGLVWVQPATYGNCSCADSSTCTQPAAFYNYTNYIPSFIVPGIDVGCYFFKSLLQSSLECLYHKSCIVHLQSFFPWMESLQITELDKSIRSIYFPNSTIQEIVDKLMIEEWNASVVYDKYYDQCQPKQCSYIYQRRYDAIYIITTLVGLVGGLVKILKIFVPRLVKFFMFLRHRRVKPQTPAI